MAVYLCSGRRGARVPVVLSDRNKRPVRALVARGANINHVRDFSWSSGFDLCHEVGNWVVVHAVCNHFAMIWRPPGCPGSLSVLEAGSRLVDPLRFLGKEGADIDFPAGPRSFMGGLQRADVPWLVRSRLNDLVSDVDPAAAHKRRTLARRDGVDGMATRFIAGFDYSHRIYYGPARPESYTLPQPTHQSQYRPITLRKLHKSSFSLPPVSYPIPPSPSRITTPPVYSCVVGPVGLLV